MKTIFYKSISIKLIIIFIISLLCFPFFIGNYDTNLLSIVLTSNYISFILNHIYIYYILKRIHMINSLYDKIKVRIGEKNFLKKYIANVCLCILIYLFIIYMVIYIFVGLPIIYLMPLFNFAIVQLSFFFIIELLGMLMIENKNNIFSIIMILINIFFRFIVSNYIASLYF